MNYLSVKTPLFRCTKGNDTWDCPFQLFSNPVHQHVLLALLPTHSIPSYLLLSLPAHCTSQLGCYECTLLVSFVHLREVRITF